MDNVEELYKNYGILADAGEKASEHLSCYQFILKATKGTTAEKRLACQFIPRFFKYFPELSEQAIDAQLDLCEDEETPIRRLAIKSLPDFCKTAPEHILKISDILTQLLQQEDATEVTIVQDGLKILISKDSQAAIEGIFSQISVGDDLVREKALRFLTSIASSGIIGKDEKSGQIILQEVKKILSDVTGDEFTSIISMLTKVKSIANKPQYLADLITEQAELDKDFQPNEPESLDRLITCTRQASPFFIKGASSAKYLDYLFKKVLPVLDNITVEASDYKYEVMKLLVELSEYATEENAKEHIDGIFQSLINLMPLQVATTEEEIEENVVAKLNFLFVECWMYAFHKLGAKHPLFLASDASAIKLKDFRSRLQYFGRMVQIYTRQSKLFLKNKTKLELAEEENKLKLLKLAACNNINILIKDLLHNPPSYKSVVIASWKSKSSPIQTVDESVEEKRKRAGITPITLDNLSPKGSRDAKKVYSLPEKRKGVQMSETYLGRNKQGYNRGNNRGRWQGNRGRRGRGGNNSNQESYESFLFR
ncbi:apoptosis inhibitor 5 [Hydra vulgaris]|uniref:Apoptosis inhibitor 5 n=1 Tax=Hydra vulgaris TaxID=6087 RepID=A0ABM4CXB7_HYDVU